MLLTMLAHCETMGLAEPHHAMRRPSRTVALGLSSTPEAPPAAAARIASPAEAIASLIPRCGDHHFEAARAAAALQSKPRVDAAGSGRETPQYSML